MLSYSLHHMHARIAALAIGLIAGTANAQPHVFWASDPVKPNETVVVLGDGLQNAKISLQEAGTSGRIRTIASAQTSETSLKFIVPADFVSGIYRYAISTANGSTAGWLNAPTIYWVQGDSGDHAVPGGWIRIMGRNIARSTQARLTLIADGRKPIVLSASKADLWNALFRVPPDLPSGAYRVSLDNGTGVEAGRVAASTIQVTDVAPPPKLSLNVRDFGASGSASQDATAAFTNALQTVAQRGGGEVFIPGGYYTLTGPLDMPAHVSLRGESRELVNLIWRDTETPPPQLIWVSNDSILQDFTVVAFNHKHIISAGFPKTSTDPRGSNITLLRLTIRASSYRGHLTPDQANQRLKEALRLSTGGGDTIRMSGQNLVLEDCDILGSGRSLYLLRPTGARVSGNRLQNGRLGWYSITGADGLIFENNDVLGADLQATGGGVNTFAHSTSSQNVLIIGNRFERLLGWDGEALTSDGPGGFYYGPVTTPRADTIIAPQGVTVTTSWRGAGVFVTGGAGAGQYARVASVSNGNLILDHPMAVSLNESSKVAIGTHQANYLMIHNEFRDTSIGIQIFGVALDHVIADNLFYRTGGIRDRGLVYYSPQPSWHTQILNNEIAQGGLTGPAFISIWGSQGAPSTTPLNVGTVVRGNRLLGNAFIELKGFSVTSPGVKDTIVEGNTIRFSSQGIVLDGGVVDTYVRNNDIQLSK